MLFAAARLAPLAPLAQSSSSAPLSSSPPSSKPAPCKTFSAVLGEAPLAAPAGPGERARVTGPLSAPAATTSSAEAGARRVLTRLFDEQAAVDRGLHAAMAGKSFSPQELLALQAQVMKYSQEMEVASRLVEKATSGIKQVLQTQV